MKDVISFVGKAMKETLGEKIKRHRKRCNYTQEDLAELLDVSSRAVSKWENERSHPSFNNIDKLSDIFNVSITELLDGSEAEIVINLTPP